MASKRELIIQAAMLAISASGGPLGLNVHRFRARDIQADDLPAVVVYPVLGDTDEGDMDGTVDRELRLRCQLRVTSDQPDVALDPLYVWVVDALTFDPTLGGLAINLAERTSQWDAFQGDRVYGALAVDFDITFETAGANPEGD